MNAKGATQITMRNIPCLLPAMLNFHYESGLWTAVADHVEIETKETHLLTESRREVHRTCEPKDCSPFPCWAQVDTVTVMVRSLRKRTPSYRTRTRIVLKGKAIYTL